MNIKEYVENLNELEFEQLCTEYLQWLYREKRVNIHGTRLKKDGGKDSVGKAVDVPYEIWAECKKHYRSIGLEEISKNVVLVISKGINELLFFSTSNITKNAIKHISIVATKHNFSVSFYYGERLYDVLKQIPRFNESGKTDIADNSQTLSVERYFTVFEDDDEYSQNSKLVLQRDNIFYIDLYLSNLYNFTLSDVECILPKVSGINFSISEIDQKFLMLKGSSRILQIRAEILNCFSAIYIPKIKIKYKINEQNNNIEVDGGLVDPTRLIYYPLSGEGVHAFLRESIKPVFISANKDSAYIINITGTAGSGKSRLLMEIFNQARLEGYQTLYCDARKQDGFYILRELLCTCIGLPYGKGNISCTLEEFQEALEKHNGNKNISNAIYNFVFLEQTDESILYYIREALIHFANNIIGRTPLFFALDNIQCLNKDTIDILYFVLNKLQNRPVHVVFGLCTNIELIPAENQENIDEFLNKISNYEKTKCLPYYCDELKDNDAKILYLHAIANLQKYDDIIDVLLSKSGKRPFDIIMTIHWLHDKKLVKQDDNKNWNLIELDKLEDSIDEIPKKNKDLIYSRFKLQCTKNFSFETKICYYDAFKLMTKSVLYFGGSVPIEFLNDIEIIDDLQFEINQSFFFKYDEKRPTISFYHDNIYRFFEDYKPFQNDRELSKQVIYWLELNQWFKFNMRSNVIFECYLRAGEYERCREYGLTSIREEKKKRNFETVVKIGATMLENASIELSSTQKFFVYYYMADSYRIYMNLSKSIDYFDKAYEILESNNISGFSEIDKCKFYHRYVNAHVSEPRYEKLLDTLDKFKTGCIRDQYYEFIMYNRYSVAYLALGEIDKSLNSIDNSIRIAKINEKPQWESISYSDKAYIFYRAYENREKAIYYFNKAVLKHVPAEATLNRGSEILAQEAFINLLKNKIEDAEKIAKKSLAYALDINSTPMEIKARNLCAIIKCFSKNVCTGISLWNKNIVVASQRKSVEGLVKAYSNIGAANLLQGNWKDAISECEKAYNLYKRNNLALMTHKPLIYNLLRLYHMFGYTQKRDKLLENEYFDNLSLFYNQLISQSNTLTIEEYWPLQYEHLYFNY